MQEKFDSGSGDRKKIKELEKKCKLLEESLKSKDPNNIGLLLQANKAPADDGKVKELKSKVSRLENEIKF